MPLKQFRQGEGGRRWPGRLARAGIGGGMAGGEERCSIAATLVIVFIGSVTRCHGQKESSAFGSSQTAKWAAAKHLITAIHAAVLPKRSRTTTECPALPDKFTPLRFDNNLWLGSSVSDIRTAFKKVPDKLAGRGSYRYEGKVTAHADSKSLEFDLTSSFEASLSRGKIVAIRASQSTSN
jgi:hypothetical protein